MGGIYCIPSEGYGANASLFLYPYALTSLLQNFFNIYFIIVIGEAVKRKKSKKRAFGSCDCSSINSFFRKKHLKDDPFWKDSGFILPDGDFIAVTKGKWHDSLLADATGIPPTTKGSCDVNDYMTECGSIYLRALYRYDKGFVINSVKMPTRDQVDTLSEYLDPHHEYMSCYGGQCVDRIRFDKPRLIDFEEWIDRCWG